MARVALPPRKELPARIPVRSIPGVGTTWYERGAGYCCRRIVMAEALGVVVIGSLLLTAGVFRALDPGTSGYEIAFTVEVLYSAIFVAFAFARTRRYWNTLEVPKVNALQQVLIVPCFLFVGLYVTLFVNALLPEPIAEHKARLWIRHAIVSN